MSNHYMMSFSTRMRTLFFFLLVGAQLSLFAQSDVSVTVTANAPTYAIYGYVTFYVTVKNNGSNTANNVTCTAQQPTGSSNSCNRTDVGFWRNWDTGAWSIGDLASGQMVTLQATVFTLSTSGITMSASVTSSSADPVSSNNTASKTVTLGAAAPYLNCDGTVVGGTGEANLSISLTANASEINVGLNVSFILTLKNSSNTTATNVKVKISVPAGMTFQVSDVSGLGSFDLASGVWTITSLQPFTNHTITANANLTQGGTQKCFAQVIASDQKDPNSTPNNYSGSAKEDDESDYNILGLLADLSMKAALKAGTPQPIKIGDNVTFVATLTNSGPTRADGVKIRSYLPTGMQYVSSSATIGIYDSALGVWILSDTPDPNNFGNKPGFTIQANTTQTLEVTFKAIQQGIITYDVEVRSDNVPDPNSTPSNFNLSENDEAQVVINVGNQTDPNAANLSLSSSIVTAPVNANDPVSVRFDIFNNGPANATNIVVKLNALPSGVTVTGTSNVGTYSANTWTIPSLAFKSSASLALSGNVGCITASTIFAQVQSATQTDLVSTHGNNTDGVPREADETAVTINAVNCVVNTPSADLRLTMTSDKTTVAAGSTVAYTLTLTNAGPSTTNSVTVKDILPTNLTLTSSTQTVGTYTNGIWNVGTLVNGQTATLTINVNVNTIPVAFTNFAQVQTSSVADPNSTPGNNVSGVPSENDEAAVTISPQVVTPPSGNLTITVVSNPTTYRQYTSNSLRITVKNGSTTASQNLKISFPFPAKTVTGGSAVASTGVWQEWCAGGTQCYTWTIPTLAANATATLDLPLYFQNATGNITATATVVGSAPTVSGNVTVTPFTGALIAQNTVLNLFAQSGQNKVHLDWVSEAGNTDYFEIQRETNKGDFEKVGIQAATPNFGTKLYNFSDVVSAEGEINYRIKAITFEGTAYFSDIRTVQMSNLNGLQVFPNPATDEITISYKSLVPNSDSKLMIYNNLGVVVQTLNLNSAIDNIVKTSVNELSTGNYYLRVVSNGKRDVVQRFVVTR